LHPELFIYRLIGEGLLVGVGYLVGSPSL